MKKFIGIFLAILFLTVSCQKEEIIPNTKSNDINQDCGCSDGKSLRNHNDDNTSGDDIIDPITDPNGDEDEQKRPRKGSK